MNEINLLGVNVDHIATLRQARRGKDPDPVQAALMAAHAGADSITVHLREDRRHIQDDDVFRLKELLKVPLNLEMASSDEIIGIAQRVKPAWTCLVPEKRQELTTEGGLDVAGQAGQLRTAIIKLHEAGINVSLFIEPTARAVQSSKKLGADAVELHTGRYAQTFHSGEMTTELERLINAAKEAKESGLIVNAGHGLNIQNIDPLAGTGIFHEFNIGFSIIAGAVFFGLAQSVKDIKEIIRACAVS
jgi:pyridoxine 5-phosphate synthase